MSHIGQNLIKLLALLLLIVAVGCNDPCEGMVEADQLTSAESRIAQLEAELDQAARDRAAAEDAILALKSEKDGLAQKLAGLEKADPGDGWKSVPGGAMITIEGTVLFDSGKAKLKSSAQGTLQQIAGAIREKFTGHDIYVFGHTDNDPIKVSGWKDNEELSCQRALSVVRHLRGLGLDQDMCAGGWGEQRPVSGDKSAKRANRRVEIFAMNKIG